MAGSCDGTRAATTPFREDITDVVKFGDNNVIAVRVDATKFEGWFYEGAGIYRHVWLEKTSPVAVAPDGIFVYSEFNDNVPTERGGNPRSKPTLLNTLADDVAATVVDCEIISPEGKSVVRFNEAMEVPGQSQETVSTRINTPFSRPVVSGIASTL